jgi:anti-sigma B factor antagonist
LRLGILVTTSNRHIRVEEQGDASVVTFVDFDLLDHLVINEVRDELVQLVAAKKPRLLVVSFNNVRRCSTAVVSGLLSTKKVVSQHGGEMRLCNMSEAIREAYRLLRLDGTVFPIYNTLSEAMADA